MCIRDRPNGARGMTDSLKKNVPLDKVEIDSIADSLCAPLHLPYSFDVASKVIDQMINISDTDMIESMKFAFKNLKLFLEPACVAGFAALKKINSSKLINQNTLIYIAFIFSGAFAGIAGLGEVSGPIGLLYRDISPNYGFTAIIVAFLGRLNPIGIVFASLVIALTYLGAEDAQLFMQIPAAVGFVFQGLVLFFLLGTELLVNYKISFRSRL